jgi:hypothetical protein
VFTFDLNISQLNPEHSFVSYSFKIHFRKPQTKIMTQIFCDMTLWWLVKNQWDVAEACCRYLQSLQSWITTHTLKMEAPIPSAKLLTLYQTTRRHTPEDLNLHPYCCEHLKFRTTKSHIRGRYEQIIVRSIVTICYYLLLFATICYYLLLFVTICYYLQP